MSADCSVKISGQAGQGIQTVGAILAEVCHQAGFHVMVINDFESRVRGGTNFIQVRIGDQPLAAPARKIDLLIAIDPPSTLIYQDEVRSDGCIIAGQTDAPLEGAIHQIAFHRLAAAAGNPITANTVAAGVALAVLGAPRKLLEDHLKYRFKDKGPDLIQSNLTAADLGYRAAEKIELPRAFYFKPQPVKGQLIEGAQALALGALAADCRLVAFYPMSPATGILENMIRHGQGLPLVVEQAEDEIAAINIAIGGAFAGVRAMTATSGGGFCLMTEGLGLAAITETPLVIIDAQRPGPATGLPTRTAQADLLFVIHAGQDEFPRFVLAPRSIDEAFEVMIRAFHLSDKYQVPVIILVDQFLTDSRFVTGSPLKLPEHIDRFTITDQDLARPQDYQRYAIRPEGISPRALPCSGKALVKVCSDEHTPDGHMTESAAERIRMADKRWAKLPAMQSEMAPPQAYHGDSQTLLVGWGATQGALFEAVDLLRKSGQEVGGVSFGDLWPFPADVVQPLLTKAKRFIMVEQNATAQLGQVIRGRTGLKAHGNILKYDGRPFSPDDIRDGFNSELG